MAKQTCFPLLSPTTLKEFLSQPIFTVLRGQNFVKSTLHLYFIVTRDPIRDYLG